MEDGWDRDANKTEEDADLDRPLSLKETGPQYRKCEGRLYWHEEYAVGFVPQLGKWLCSTCYNQVASVMNELPYDENQVNFVYAECSRCHMHEKCVVEDSHLACFECYVKTAKNEIQALRKRKK